MKENLSRVWRCGLALLLAVCLVVGMVPPVTFASEPNVETDLNYVSIGDSMTNGYGLPGYNGDAAIENYGDGSYANQFAAWLGADDHAQLAMNGLRAEDLHWLLTLNYEDAAAIALAEGAWDEAAWNAKFSCGDYWTWSKICAGNDVAQLAEYFQKKVAEADLISLAVGNDDLGMFLFERGLEIAGVAEGDALIYKIENAIRDLEPALQNKFLQLKDQLYAIAAEEAGVDMNDPKVKAAADMVVYTALSFLLNYMGAIDALLELNPDVDIILVGTMNTYGDKVIVENKTVGSLLDAVQTPLNAFIAGLPALLLAVERVENDFYYAKANNVQCLVDVYGDDFYANGVPVYSVIRDSFVKTIVGYCGHDVACTDAAACTKWENGLVWNLLEDQGLVRITLADVLAYDALDLEGKADFAVENAEKAASLAAYLALEAAVLEAKDASVNLNTLVNLSEESLQPVLDALEADGTYSNEVLEAAAAAVVKMARDEYDVYLTVEQVLDLYNDQSDANILKFAFILAGGVAGVPASVVEKLYYGIPVSMPEVYEAVAMQAVDKLKAEYGVEVEITAATVELLYNGDMPTALDVAYQVVAQKASEELGLTITAAEIEAIDNGNNDVAMDLACKIIAKEAEIEGLDAELVEKIYNGDADAARDLIFDQAADAEDNTYGFTAEDFEDLYNGVTNAHIMEIIYENADVEDLDADTIKALNEGNRDVAMDLYIDAVVDESGLDRETVEDVVLNGVAPVDVVIDIITGETDDLTAEQVAALVKGTKTPTDLAIELIAEETADLTAEQVAALVKGTKTPFDLAIELIAEEEGVTEDEIRDAYDTDAEVKDAVDEAVTELNDLKAEAADLINELADLKAEADDAVADLTEVRDEADTKVDEIIDEAQTEIADAIAEMIDEVQTQVNDAYDEMVPELIDGVDEAIVEINDTITDGVDEAVDEILDTAKTGVDEAKEALEKAANDDRAEVIDGVNDAQDAIRNDVLPAYESLCKLLVLPETVADAIEGDAEIEGVLSLFARCFIGNGLGGHPSQAGHDTIFEALKYGYLNQYTEQLEEILEWSDDVYREVLHIVGIMENVYEFLEKAAIDTGITDYDSAVAVLKGQLENLNDRIDAIMASNNTDAKQLINDIKALSNELTAAIKEFKAVVLEVVDVIEHGALDALDQADEAALRELKDLLLQELDVLEVSALALNDALLLIVSHAKDIVEELIYDATHTEIVIDNNFKYVALGDGTVAGYAEALTGRLNAGANANGVRDITFVDASVIGNTFAKEAANLSSAVVDADLITLGFSQADVMGNAWIAALEELPVDWESLLGEKAVYYVDTLLDTLNANIDLLELGGDNAELMQNFIETYTYGLVEYFVYQHKLIDAIREVNADAEIIIVGSYNPAKDVTVTLKGLGLELDLDEVSEIFDYLNKAIAGYGIGLTVAYPGVTYVDAPKVEKENNTLGSALLDGDISNLYPSTNGAAYIARRIYDALTITYVIDSEVVLLGDVNLDGVVNSSDLNALYRYIKEDEGVTLNSIQMIVADVNQDGTVNSSDLNVLYRYIMEDATLAWVPVEVSVNV